MEKATSANVVVDENRFVLHIVGQVTSLGRSARDPVLLVEILKLCSVVLETLFNDQLLHPLCALCRAINEADTHNGDASDLEAVLGEIPPQRRQNLVLALSGHHSHCLIDARLVRARVIRQGPEQRQLIALVDDLPLAEVLSAKELKRAQESCTHSCDAQGTRLYVSVLSVQIAHAIELRIDLDRALDTVFFRVS